MKFDDNNASPRTYTWKSNALAWMRLIASQQQGYWQIVIPISLLISMQTIRFITQAVTNKSPFRLPRNGRYRVWQVEVIGVDAIREVAISETVTELQV